MQCVNNLKQFGIAVHGYANAIGSFPPGQLEGNDWADWSAHTFLLPYLEQVPIYNAINFHGFGFGMNPAHPTLEPANTTAVWSRIALFLCPSDVDRATTPNGHNNYAACSGSSPDSCARRGPFNGPFIGPDPTAAGNASRVAQVYALRDVLDGLSQTACFSEKLIGLNLNKRDPLRPAATVFAVPIPNNPSIPNQYFDSCRSINAATAPPVTGQGFDLDPTGIGCAWSVGYPSQTRYTHVMPPNGLSCDYGDGGANIRGAHTASSRHGSIVNVLFCDGSVRVIKESINVATWWALGTMANGEVVSAEGY